MERERFSLVDVFENHIWTASCPVDIRQGALIYDALVGQHCIQLQMVNLDSRQLVSVYVDVYCYDEGGNLLLGEPINIIYRDLNSPKGGYFGDTETFYLRSGRVSSVSCHVVQVMFRSGEIWRPAGRPVRVTAQPFDSLNPDLQKVFFRKLRESYFSGVDTEFKVLARQDRDFWVCACGKANDNDQDQCQRCGMNRAWILQNMDPQTLEAFRDEQQEDEPREQTSAEPSTAQQAAAPGIDAARAVRTEPAAPRPGQVSGETNRYVPIRDQVGSGPSWQAPAAQQRSANRPPQVPPRRVATYDAYEDEERYDEDNESISLVIKIALGVASVLLLATIGGILWYFLR